MLTLQMLKDMKPDTLFATGIAQDTPEELNFYGSGQTLRWVAVRGGIHDWAVYVGTTDRTDEDVRRYGDKIHNKTTIKKLVPCDEEALAMYRD